jgi:hypothetical protein
VLASIKCQDQPCERAAAAYCKAGDQDGQCRGSVASRAALLRRLRLLCLDWLLLTPLCLRAQLIVPEENRVTLAAAAQKEIVEAVAKILAQNYVFPDQGKRMSKTLRRNLQNNAYAKLIAPQALLAQLYQDLQVVNRDGHLRLNYLSRPGPEWHPIQI